MNDDKPSLEDIYENMQDARLPKVLIPMVNRKWPVIKKANIVRIDNRILIYGHVDYITEGRLEKLQDIRAKTPLLHKGLRLCSKIEEIGGEGAQCIVVGGAVRDLILGKEINDIDLATNVSIEEIEKHFKVDEIGANKTFGILNVHFEGEQFEVAHFRTESTYSDSRHPDKVELTNTFEKDSERRDFTWNAMGLKNNGELIDYHGGIPDLENKILRAVGNAKVRFTEDALRMLRAARQAASLGFEIEPHTKEAIIELKDTINNVSKERIAEELYKAAKSGPSLAKYLEHLDEVSLLQTIFPELYALKPFQHSLQHHPEAGGNVLGHVLECIRVSRSNDPITNIAIMGHDFGKATTYQLRDGHKHTYYGHEEAGIPLVEAMGQRLKLVTKDIDIMKFCAGKHMLVHKIYELSKKKLVDLVNHPYWPYLKEVAYADEKSRMHLFNEEEFEKKIKYAEDTVNQINSGGGPNELKKKLKTLIDGNLILQWIPDLQKHEMKPFIGTLMKAAHEWIVNNNKFDITQDQIKQFIINKYNELKGAKTFKEFINI